MTGSPAQTVDKQKCVIMRNKRELQMVRSEWAANGRNVALVPTMGGLHKGHEELIKKARKLADKTIVSLFVNPTQFANNEDFDGYPRNEQQDFQLIANLGVDGIYFPDITDMYPDGFSTQIVVGGPAIGLESRFRPHFFRGVATVVTKLILQTFPEWAVFGEKDYQQLLVVKQMVKDLDIPVEIVAAPIVRHDDGLAYSSRNSYLSAKERGVAATLYKVLNLTARSIMEGNGIFSSINAAEQHLSEVGFSKVDYISLCDNEYLRPVKSIRNSNAGMRLLGAAWIGKTRLIDNIALNK